jgi:phosphatidylserine/phosphatidylglycerophosphate/cardiolipin synthase-like enzyme
VRQKVEKVTRIKCVEFGPKDNILNSTLEEVKNAKHSVYVMHFWFTWKPFADALIGAQNRKVAVHILTDKRSLLPLEAPDRRYDISCLEYLQKNGVSDIRIYTGALFHHKVILIDDAIVISGSMNLYRNSILEHCENLVILEDKALNEKFKEEFSNIRDIQSDELGFVLARQEKRKLRTKATSLARGTLSRIGRFLGS